MTAKISARVKPRARDEASRLGWLGDTLAPIDILSEAIFSILIVLTFTLAYRVLRLGPGSDAGYTTRLFIGALGAVVAWGAIDGIMYALMSLFERGEKHRLLQRLRDATTEDEGIEAIADELDYTLEPITREEQRRALYADVLEHLADAEPQPVRLSRDDVMGAVASLIVAVVAVLPALVPLLIFASAPSLAIRLSNIVSFIVLFACGYQWGKHAGSNPWRTGLALAAVSAVMVLVAILLGG